MSDQDEKIEAAIPSKDLLVVHLVPHWEIVNGESAPVHRGIAMLLAWYPRLASATPEQRANCKIIGDGRGLHWPDLNQYLSLTTMLENLRAHGLLPWTG